MDNNEAAQIALKEANATNAWRKRLFVFWAIGAVVIYAALLCEDALDLLVRSGGISNDNLAFARLATIGALALVAVALILIDVKLRNRREKESAEKTGLPLSFFQENRRRYRAERFISFAKKANEIGFNAKEFNDADQPIKIHSLARPAIYGLCAFSIAISIAIAYFANLSFLTLVVAVLSVYMIPLVIILKIAEPIENQNDLRLFALWQVLFSDEFASPKPEGLEEKVSKQGN
jgi:hypothetical protein